MERSVAEGCDRQPQARDQAFGAPVIVNCAAQLLCRAINYLGTVPLLYWWLGGGTSRFAPLQADIFFIDLPFDLDGTLMDTQRTIFGSVSRQLMKQQRHTGDRPFAD